MDIGTHLLVPYAAALLALGFWRKDAHDPRRASWALVFGVAGFAPDLDGLMRPLVRAVDEAWYLQHRGLSHSFVGAPLYAFFLMGVLALLARRWPRPFGLFAWRWSLVPFIVVGSWTHLALDSVTYAGVPALFPFTPARYSLELYHWLISWLLPLSAVVLGLHAFGKLNRRGVIVGGLAVTLVIAGIGAARLVERPTPGEGVLIFPRPTASEWTLVERLPNGTWQATLWRDGAPTNDTMLVPDDAPQEAGDAIRLARATPAFRGFELGSYGPMATRAFPLGDGAWEVQFLDVAQRFDATHRPRWTPTDPYSEWGLQTFRVENGTAVETHRGW